MRPSFLLLAVIGIALSLVACGDPEPSPDARADDSPPERAWEFIAWDWDPEGPAGPTRWGALHSKFRACGEGRAQSPIDLWGRTGDHKHDVEFKWGLRRPDMARDDWGLRLINLPDRLMVEGVEYKHHETWFHAPSEHRLKGQAFALEMQVYHRSESGDLVAVSVLFKRGKHLDVADTLLRQVPKSNPAIAGGSYSVDRREFLPGDLTYYSYAGSTTRPPCTEGVRWFVLTTPVEMSFAQLELFRSIGNGNNRPLQPANDRVISEGRAR